MKRNPVIPFGIIAVVGILAVIIISFVGVDQRADRMAEENGEPEQSEEGGGEGGETASDPQAIYDANCMSCHGADMSGGMGPDLTTVGQNYSADEIVDIIQNGTGSMPAQTQVSEEESTALAEWLVENNQ